MARAAHIFALWAACSGSAGFAQAAPLAPDGGFWWGGQVHGAFLSDLVEGEPFDLAGGLTVAGGYRFPESNLGVWLTLDNTWWAQATLERTDRSDVFDTVPQGSLNLGVGLEGRYFEDNLRWTLGGGPTLLLLDTAVDRANTVGLFLDMRPTGVFFDLHDSVRVLFDPLVFTIMIPDFSGIPQVLILYRTVISLEVDLL